MGLTTDEQTRDLRTKWRAAGLCIHCGSHPALPGLVSCQSCRHNQSRYIQNRIESGLCQRCSCHRDSQATRCKNCREAEAGYIRRYRALRKEVMA